MGAQSLLQLLRSRVFVAVVHVGLWVLLYLIVAHLRGASPGFPDSPAQSQPVVSVVPVARLSSLFAPGVWAQPPAETNRPGPFYSTYFAPAPAPAPPPPTTRKFGVTYLGYFQSAAGTPSAMVRLTNEYLVVQLGKRMLSNQFAAQISGKVLTLTNTTAQTNLLQLNVLKEVEVPIQ
jgi:hypothetical protein